jgi:type I restriction enzyme S subunit
MGDQDHIGENLRAYMQAFSPAVRDIFESFEFHTQIDKLAKSGLLYMVTEKFATIDLHPDVVSNAEMGAVFEELIRKFAELSNETAGEHFTPREVIRLMVNLLFIEDDAALTKPGVVRSLYDPTAGTGGMLSVAGEHLASLNPDARLVMYGQELNPESYANRPYPHHDQRADSMSFPRYPEYKDSGVEWLGEVPGHWGVGSARWLTRRFSGGTPDKAKLEYWEDGTIPWLNSGAVNDRLITEPSTYITAEAFANSSAKWIPKGALVMALAGQGKTKGMVAQLGIPSTCNQSMAAIIPSNAIEARFLFWWLDANYQNIRNMAGGDLRDGLNLELLGNIQCPLPSPGEQIQIAAFLDREASKIDALVAEQRRLMELLKEKRQAVISHAVTGGLNPDAPMKPSGIESLGDVPKHWEVCKMKWIAEMQSGHTPDKKIPEYWENGDIAWVSLNDTGYLKDHDYISETAYNITQLGIMNSSARMLPAGVVVFSRDATIGRCAITTKPMAVSQHFIAWVCGESMIPEFLLLRLRSMTGELDRLTTGATLKTIGMPDVRTLMTPVPPLEEQKTIIAYVAEQTGQLDTLTTEAQRAIDLLQERRTALISAAVTGQIDVRGAV